GAGETGQQAARNMQARGVKKVIVTNRTLDRAAPLAQCFKCEILPFQHLDEGLQAADIVISCTSSPEPILTRQTVTSAMAKRAQSDPLMLIDLAVPRDIEESVAGIAGVALFNIDDLQSVVEANAEKRMAEAEKAHILVNKAAEKFADWQRTLIAVPTIRELQTLFSRIQKEELAKYSEQVTPEELQRIEKVSGAITRRIAQLAISRMKEASGRPNAQAFFESVQRLFDLEDTKQ
ncbi:MAG TPA: glutamyl-tRNA reductase, partial [bacterium]|nr:glutamyl-tRNA reductase [bacterium]